MNRKFLFFLLLFCQVFFSAACFNYKDINTNIFVTSFILDIDDNNEIIFYVEAFKPLRGYSKETGTQERLTFKSTGRTVQEVVRKNNLVSSNWMDYSQNMAIIFTERAAKRGLMEIIDFIDRDQAFLLRPNVMVFEGDPEELIKIKLEEEVFLGSFLNELTKIQLNTSQTVPKTINDFFNDRLGNRKTYILPKIKLSTDIQDKVAYDGCYIFKDDKIKVYLDRQESFYYNLLNGTFKRGILTVGHPEVEGSHIVVDILGYRHKSKVELAGEEIIYKVNLSLIGTFMETQSAFTYNQENIDLLQAAGKKELAAGCQALFEKLQENEVDVLGIKRDLKIKYPHLDLEDPLQEAKLALDIDFKIEQSEDTLNFR